MNKSIAPVFGLIMLALLSSGCREQGNVRIQPLTHLASGQTTTLVAYEEQQPFRIFKTAQTKANDPITRIPVTPKWSVSDAAVATVDEAGNIRGLKPGAVAVKGVWQEREASVNVQIVPSLPLKYLPQLTTEGTIVMPREVTLSLANDRTLKFHAAFDKAQEEVTLEQKAPDQKLPWTFTAPNGVVEITSAAGLDISGTLKPKQGGKLSFTVRSEGDGVYPVSLQGKTFMLVGDSMAEGLAWYLRARIEGAGGKFFSEPWYSSTTIAWQGERRMTELVAKYKPDIIFIALGSNEVIVPNVGSRSAAVKQISEEMGDRPSYWIGPPSWKPDKGIVHVIEENFRPGHFYNSNDLQVPRRKDGAHPTPEGFKTWADLVWNWYARIG